MADGVGFCWLLSNQPIEMTQIVESLMALKDLMNRFNTELVCTEESFPNANGGSDLRFAFACFIFFAVFMHLQPFLKGMLKGNGTFII